MKVDITEVLKIADDMKGQDGRSTAFPIFMVMQRSWFSASGADENQTIPVPTFVQPFFSEKAADQFIKENAHNLEKPFVYVASGYRNREWETLRRMLQQMNGELV